MIKPVGIFSLEESMMNRILKFGKEFLVIAFAMAVAACAAFFFLLPSGVTIGSVSGLAAALAEVLPLPVSTIMMAINILLLVLGFLLVDADFCKKTILSSLLLPVYLGILERVFPEQQSLTNDPFLDMLGYIFIVSIAMAILFHNNASSGGLDILAKIMNKYLRMNLGQAGSLAGLLVAATSVFFYDSKAVFLSFLGTYLQGLVVDHFIFGLRVKKRVCILSQKEDEMRNFILHELHSGATIYEAIGAYDEKTRREIITIVDKSEYSKLMNYISKTDPAAFVTVYAVSEMIYRPKPVIGRN